MLCQQLARIAAGHFSTRDFTIDRLRAALQAYVLAFPVYRTYVTAAGASAEDRKLIEDAIARARADWEGPDPDIFDFLRDVITLDLAHNPGYSAPRVRNFALKLQQFTGPLTAKALEDTAFYRYHRLLALNEVGGDPALPALTLDEFHRRQQQHAEDRAERRSPPPPPTTPSAARTPARASWRCRSWPANGTPPCTNGARRTRRSSATATASAAPRSATNTCSIRR